MWSTDFSLLLPHHPAGTTDDPLGLSDATEYPTPAYPIIKQHLLGVRSSTVPITFSEQTLSGYISAVSDLSYTLHNRPDPNLDLLKSCLRSHKDPIALIRRVIDAAETLPTHFPSGELPALKPGEARTYTIGQLTALAAHQFLLTLRSPPWNDWGGVNLDSWFSDADGISEPKRIYINIALDFFTNHASDPPTSIDGPQALTFHLCHTPSLPSLTTVAPLAALKIIEVPEEADFPTLSASSDSSRTHTTYIISSHRLIGHGPSGTQEERLLASIPELLPASTFTPPLEETTALAVTAAPGFIPTAVFTGHGRTARRDNSYDRSDYATVTQEPVQTDTGDDSTENIRIRADTMLFLNATELDAVDDEQDGLLPDFLPGMLEKDLLKAYTGFHGVFSSPSEASKHRIIAPPWGCGAFSGDIRVKLLLLWIAASFAAANVREQRSSAVEVELVFLVKQLALDVKEGWWKECIERIERSGVTAYQVWSALLEARTKRSTAVFESVVEALGLQKPRSL
ncbi:hypothetical protein ABW21_db0208438 [Orbilia brochopaga]|nr:hypothetical protein ABW21_db0208438 [Drechslerella brochopaga]